MSVMCLAYSKPRSQITIKRKALNRTYASGVNIEIKTRYRPCSSVYIIEKTHATSLNVYTRQCVLQFFIHYLVSLSSRKLMLYTKTAHIDLYMNANLSYTVNLMVSTIKRKALNKTYASGVNIEIKTRYRPCPSVYIIEKTHATSLNVYTRQCV